MGSITVQSIGKAYKVYPSRWARLKEWFVPGAKARHTLKWVLQDISFQVQPGEAVGIIGMNGAGKSTLLKLITGTVRPTTGQIAMHGRVAAMLELGMGFLPDFTGRQNVYMAGQLIGLSVETIHELMPEIEAFAEIGSYIDEPVRVYSSGMQVRLAFSLATAVRPDILIVDEALSVGDAYFQHKSFKRIREFRAAGTTLLLVSHDKHAIQSICDRAMLLRNGRVELEGPPESVMDYYNALLADVEGNQIKQVRSESGALQTVSGSGLATIERIRLLNAAGDVVQQVTVGQKLRLSIEAKALADLPQMVVGFMIKDKLGQPIFGINSFYLESVCQALVPGQCVVHHFDFEANLGIGTYSIAVALTRDRSHVDENFEWRDLALVFEVLNGEQPIFAGCAWIPTTMSIDYDA